MAEDGARASANPRAEAQMAAAFDPVAWERRVNEARERRAQALARRAVSGDAAPPQSALQAAASATRPRPRRPGPEFPRRDAGLAPDDPPPPFLGHATPRDAEPEPQAAPIEARRVAPDPADAAVEAGDAARSPLARAGGDAASAPIAEPAASAGAEPDQRPAVGRGIGGVMAAVFAGGLILGLGLAFLLTGADRSPPPIEAMAPVTTAAPPPTPMPGPVEIAAPPALATPTVVAPPPFAPAAATREPPAEFAATAPPQPQPTAAQPPIAAPPGIETPAPAPTPGPETALPAVVTPPPPAPRAAEAPPPEPAVAAAGLAVRIVLHAPNGAVAARAETLAADLRAQGYDVTGPVAVDFAINRSNARYYHDADAEAASAFAAALAAASGEPAEPRDFTHAAARPAPGVLEVWLAGAPARPGPAAAPPPQQQQGASGLGGALRGLGRAVNDLDRRLQRGFIAITP